MAVKKDFLTVRERFVSQDEVRMFVREAGEPGAPAILLLHDLEKTSVTFEPLMGLLSDRYHLVAPDLIGFGRSDKPADATFGYDFRRLGAHASGLMEKLGIESYACYAQGSAGPAALGVFEFVKEQVTAMIMQGATWSAGRLSPNSVKKADGLSDTDPLWHLLRHFVWNRWHLVDSWQHTLHSYAMDMLVLWGEQDEVTPPSEAEEIREVLSNATIVMMDAAHDVLATRTPDVAREVDAFLRDVATRQ